MVRDELRREYRFDYSRAKRNRFAAASTRRPVVVVLDDDIARVFRSSESVNALLRAVIASMPRGPRRRKTPSREKD